MSEPLPCPLPRSRVVDLYFMEHRAKLLDIAAFLDRLERAVPDDGDDEDFRVAALRRAIAILEDGDGERARRVLELFSDHSTDPIEVAGGKGAFGACPEEDRGACPEGTREANPEG